MLNNDKSFLTKAIIAIKAAHLGPFISSDDMSMLHAYYASAEQELYAHFCAQVNILYKTNEVNKQDINVSNRERAVFRKDHS
jgi:hypothetical protein